VDYRGLIDLVDPFENALTQSSLDRTRMCLRKVRAILPESVSTMFSYEPAWASERT
jgi:hypothetical protein